MANQHIKVRIKFKKHGVLRFIGHLDMMRYFQKAFRRSEIDIAYTQGFSPHQIMSFASPLGVGVESDGEYMDIELNSMKSSRDIVERLGAQMAEGIEILSARVLPEKATSAMAYVAAAGYFLSFRSGFEPENGWECAVEAFMNRPEILVRKETKKGETMVDLKAGIYAFRAASYAGKPCLYLLCNASSSGNIKPSMVVGALFETIGRELEPFELMITREDTYAMENEQLVPLDAIGTVVEESV